MFCRELFVLAWNRKGRWIWKICVAGVFVLESETEREEAEMGRHRQVRECMLMECGDCVIHRPHRPTLLSKLLSPPLFLRRNMGFFC